MNKSLFLFLSKMSKYQITKMSNNSILKNGAINEIILSIKETKKDTVLNNLRCCISFLNALRLNIDEERETLLETVRKIENRLSVKGTRVIYIKTDLEFFLNDLKNLKIDN